MEIYDNFFVIVFALAVSSTSANNKFVLRNQQVAVTSFVGLEDFYVRIKKERPFTYVDDGQLGYLRQEDYAGVIQYENYRADSTPPLVQRLPVGTEACYDLWEKSYICTRIFNSAFFDMQDEKAVHFTVRTHDIMEVLHQRHRDLYDDIYGNWPRARAEWLNPYRRRDVLIGDEKFDEHVFRCVALKRVAETHSYVGYYISPIYQSSAVENPMNGRFVFKSDENNKLKLLAIAEQPALVDGYVIEKALSDYYAERTNQHPDEDETCNGVCLLIERDKIRLCALVLNGREFPDRITFYPTKDNVEHKCEKRKVLARLRVITTPKNNGYYNREAENTRRNIDMTYDEWMIGCRAKLNNTNEEQSYYISRGLDERTAIVFKLFEEDIYSPYIGISDVEVIFGFGSIKNVLISSSDTEKEYPFPIITYNYQ